MKLKKKIVSLVISATLMMNVLGVYAGAVNIDKAWSQLSSSQKAKFEQVGISKESLGEIDSMAGGLDLSLFVSPPLSYENDRFTVSQKNAEQVLRLLSMRTGAEFDKESMLATFNEVVADINNNSTETTRKDFADLLGQYSMVNQSGKDDFLPEGGGGPVVQVNTKEKLEQRLEALKAVESYNKLQKVDFQQILEVLSSYVQDPLTSVTPDNLKEAWNQSSQWQKDNANGLVFAKKNAPIARINMPDNGEIIIPQGLWNDASALGKLSLEAGSIVLSIDKNTYTNGTSKVVLKPISKEGYQGAVTISSTAKIYSPAKISFYVDAETPEEYGVYKLENNKEILIGGIYNQALGTVEALVKSSGTYVLKKTTPNGYKDLADVTWAKDQINHLGQKGYIAGKSDGVFAPKDDITRAEFAVLLTRVLQLPGTSMKNKFTDMKSDAWYYNDVMATVEAKLFNGKSATGFDPNGKITRQELAAVMSRILVQKGYSEPKVENVPKGIWAPGALALLKDQSFVTDITGFNDTVGKNANRAEVAYILYNLLQR